MRTLTRFVAAVVTAAVAPACSVIARSVAHADPGHDGDRVEGLFNFKGAVVISLSGVSLHEEALGLPKSESCNAFGRKKGTKGLCSTVRHCCSGCQVFGSSVSNACRTAAGWCTR